MAMRFQSFLVLRNVSREIRERSLAELAPEVADGCFEPSCSLSQLLRCAWFPQVTAGIRQPTRRLLMWTRARTGLAGELFLAICVTAVTSREDRGTGRRVAAGK